MREENIAIITARGGSKRIPRKNIKKFCGKPIIQYSIEAAKKAGIFDEIMVSTDDEEIAEIAKSCGAAVPFYRSERTSGDFATTADVILEVLEAYQNRGREFEYAFCLYPTAPFITAEKLVSALERIKQERGFKLLPVVPFSYPPQRGVIIDEAGRIQMKEKENFRKRSQDLEKLYHDCGQFYIYHVEEYVKARGEIWEHVIPFVMNELEVQDIDTLDDWHIAELKYEYFKDCCKAEVEYLCDEVYEIDDGNLNRSE